MGNTRTIVWACLYSNCSSQKEKQQKKKKEKGPPFHCWFICEALLARRVSGIFSSSFLPMDAHVVVLFSSYTFSFSSFNIFVVLFKFCSSAASLLVLALWDPPWHIKATCCWLWWGRTWTRTIHCRLASQETTARLRERERESPSSLDDTKGWPSLSLSLTARLFPLAVGSLCLSFRSPSTYTYSYTLSKLLGGCGSQKRKVTLSLSLSLSLSHTDHRSIYWGIKNDLY